MFIDRKRADRGGKSLLHVGVTSGGDASSHQLFLPDAAFCARDSESFPEFFSSPASIDSMPPGLVSFR
jgi:hypothetical protein